MRRRSLYFTEPRRVEVMEEDTPSPSPGEVLVETLVSGVSAGTEMLFYRHHLDEGTRLDTAIGSLDAPLRYPFKYGYSAVGRVVGAGEDTPHGLIGRTVFAFHPHESHFTARPEELVPVAEGIGPEDAIFLPSVETALSIVMDGAPMMGEDVVVIGQGVIGLLTTALLSRHPLSSIITMDRYPKRREMSGLMGAGMSLEHGIPPAELVRRAGLGRRKADLVFELSGDPAAMEYATHVAGFEGRIVVGSWYGNKEAVVNFGEDFHRNRLRIASSQVSTVPSSLSGRWDKRRRLDLAWKALAEVRPRRLITHRVDIDDAARAYDLIDRNGEDVIQVMLDYRGGN